MVQVMFSHVWSFMVIDGPSWSFYTWSMQILEIGAKQVLLDLSDIDCLKLFEFYHRPSHLPVWCWVDIDDCLSSSGTEPQASQKMLGTLCSLCQSPNHHERLKCYGYQPNWLVWQDARKTQSLVQDQPKTEDSVPIISLEKCYASWWCGTVGG